MKEMFLPPIKLTFFSVAVLLLFIATGITLDDIPTDENQISLQESFQTASGGVHELRTSDEESMDVTNDDLKTNLQDSTDSKSLNNNDRLIRQASSKEDFKIRFHTLSGVKTLKESLDSQVSVRTKTNSHIYWPRQGRIPYQTIKSSNVKRIKIHSKPNIHVPPRKRNKENTDNLNASKNNVLWRIRQVNRRSNYQDRENLTNDIHEDQKHRSATNEGHVRTSAQNHNITKRQRMNIAIAKITKNSRQEWLDGSKTGTNTAIAKEDAQNSRKEWLDGPSARLETASVERYLLGERSTAISKETQKSPQEWLSWHRENTERTFYHSEFTNNRHRRELNDEQGGYLWKRYEQGGYLRRGHSNGGAETGYIYNNRSQTVKDNRDTERCGGVPWCSCLNKTIAYCDGGGKDFAYFPRLPSSITKIYFYDNFLPIIRVVTISNLTHLPLTYLNMGNNSLTGCEEGAFSALRFLEFLTIEDERLSADEFRKCLIGLNKTAIRSLVFPEIILSNFSKEIFSGLTNSNVRLVQFYGTEIKIFDQRFFSGLPELRHIRLNNCKITVTKLLKSSKLKEISFSKNRILNFPRFCVHGKPVYRNIEQIYLDNNYIRVLSPSDVSCMNELRNLSLIDNPIAALYDNMFSHLSKLNWLEVTIVMSGDVTIEPLALNSSSLTYLFLSGFQEAIEWSDVDLRLFSYCPNLKSLTLSGNSLRLLSEDDFYLLLSPLKELRYLDLSRTELRFLPEVIHTDLLKLEILYVVDNKIIGWPDYFFSPLKNFRIFDVYFNSITMLNKTSFTMAQIRSMEMITINQNPFVCTCDLLWFINLLRSREFEKTFDGYPNGFTCNSPPEFQNILIDKTPISDRYCSLTTPMAYSLISVTLFIIACILIASVVYRYRWYIKYATYMIHFLQRRRQRLRNDNAADFALDLYVSCSDEEFDMLYENVITKLENELGLRVYVSHRDGIGLRMDSIVQNMDDSRQVVLFLSNSFAQDHYCEFEASIAFERFLHEKSNCMVVVLLQTVNALNLSSILYRIIKTGEYICWHDDPDGRNLFWLKFENAIKNKNDIRP